MTSKENKENGSGQLTLEEAVETLSSIAEMDLDRDAAKAIQQEIVSADSPVLKIVQSIQNDHVDEAVEVIKETFRVILHHLKNYAKKEDLYFPNQQSIENIKAIMLLVGEAAKKLDRYSELVHNTQEITQLKEYKKLQDFYLTRIARKVDEKLLTKWIMGLSQRVFETMPETAAPLPAKPLQATHVFVELDGVKKDGEYELFFIRKEDGSRFFSPRLIRNIKLICDFGRTISGQTGDDFLESVEIWRDRYFQATAKEILAYAAPAVQNFYHDVMPVHEQALSPLASKMIMALMLCSHPKHQTHDPAIKNCSDYFNDFQNFLREILTRREYQKMIAYPFDNTPVEKMVMELVQTVCRGFFIHTQGLQEFRAPLQKILEECQENYGLTIDSQKQLWMTLAEEYSTCSKLFKAHSDGPLVNMLDLLESGQNLCFDPLMQGNVPSQLYDLEWNNKHMVAVRMASPTSQEFINRVNVVEEFKEFLRGLPAGEKHLIINLQDRTSWREEARSLALEELQMHPDFSDKLVVVTMAKDTEFYQQWAPFNYNNHADQFIKVFQEQLTNDFGGFYFPDSLKAVISKEVVEGVLHSIHRIFFAGRNVLPRERRMDFIEVFYLFLQLKIVEEVAPSSFSFVCKDGIDVSETASVQFFSFLKSLKGETLTKKDMELVNVMLWGPTLLIRERVPLQDRFTRMINTLKEIEAIEESLGKENFAKAMQATFSSFLSGLK